MAAGRDVTMHEKGVTAITERSHDFAPRGRDSVYQVVVRFLRRKRATLTTDEYLARSDLLRKKAENEMHMGRALISVLASVLCINNASLSSSKKSLVLASADGYPGISAVVRQVRRFFGPRSSAARLDFLAATDEGANSNDEEGFAAWIA